MMKKWTTLLLLCLFVLGLTACNSTASPVVTEEDASKETPSNTTKEEPKVSELTLEEVYQNALDRQNEIASLTSEVSMEQIITSGDQEMTIQSDMTMDMTLDPMAMYAKGVSTMADPSTGIETPMGYEIYLAEDGFFMYDEMSAVWMKLPNENYEQLMGETAEQADASQHLAMLQSFVEDFTFEQNDDQYILTLDASGEKFNDFVMEQALNSGAIPTEDQAIIDSIEFKDMNYVILINKETFDTEEIKMVMEMVESTSGESVLMNTTMGFSNINSVDAIEVPQEVLDTAVGI